MKFDSFSFAKEILQAVNECGYQTLTPIQRQAIPAVRKGLNVLASAQTGTGKTAAFALPILQKLVEQQTLASGNNAKALILTPTRELAEQIGNNIKAYSKYINCHVVTLFGGKPKEAQAKKLNQGCDIIIATPGRLIEHITSCTVALSDLDYLVLDEADRMLDMGFLKDIQRIIQVSNKERQTLMFSATFSGGVRKLADEIMPKHKLIVADKQNTTAINVSQVVYPVEQKRKHELLAELIGRKNWHQVLVFSSTREESEKLAKELNLDGINTAVIHSEKAQGTRRRALRDFKESKVRVLVSTEVAARGLDIPDLEYVVNFDLPFLPEDYVHRIGRTGRAGKSGTAISFVSREEERTLADIEKLIGQKLKRISVPGYEVSNRDLLLKQLQKRRSFAKKKAIESDAFEQIAAEKSMADRRTKVKVGSKGIKTSKKIK